MAHAYIVDAQHPPFSRHEGALASMRADDLGAVPIKALMARHPAVDCAADTDIAFGCTNTPAAEPVKVAGSRHSLLQVPRGPAPGVSSVPSPETERSDLIQWP